MARQRYEPGKGVVAMEWHDGTPPTDEHNPFVVEVWRPSISLFGLNPLVRIQAELEIHVRTEEGQWMEVRWGGLMKAVRPGTVKRYASLGARWWDTTINIDGWGR